MNAATCTKQCCVGAKVMVVAGAMMRKGFLIASRHLDVDVAGLVGILVSGERELENKVSNLGWKFEERRGGLRVHRNCLICRLFCVAGVAFSLLAGQSWGCTKGFVRLSIGVRLCPITCNWLRCGHRSIQSLIFG